MMRVVKSGLCTLLAIGMSAVAAYGSVNIETFDAEGDITDWFIKDIDGGAAIGSLSWVPTAGSHSGVLQDSFTRPAPFPGYFEIIYTTDADLIASAIASASGGGSKVIEFDFYSGGAVPLETYAFFGTGTHAWFSDVSASTVVSGWGSAGASLSWGNWFNMSDPVRGFAQFAGDVADMTQIGVMVYYRNVADAQIYGIDNFDVVDAIPEPETWAFLGIAFLSIGYSFRDRLDKTLSGLRIRILG